MAKLIHENEREGCCIAFARLFLAATNACFLIIGAATMYLGASLDQWWLKLLSIPGVNFPEMKESIAIGVISMGALIFLLALIGCCGVQEKSRFQLCAYNTVVVFAGLVFILAGAGYVYMLTIANQWQSHPYPADTSEVVVASSFNEVYCNREARYFCHSVSGVKAVSLFFGTNASEVFERAVGANAGLSLNETCSDPYFVKTNGIKPVCDLCRNADTEGDADINEHSWINRNCYPDSAMAGWCTAFILSGEAPSRSNSTPYSHCRKTLLGQMWTVLLYVSIALSVCAAYCIVSGCIACNMKKARQTTTGENEPLIGQGGMNLG